MPQDGFCECAKDVLEFQDAVLSQIRRGGFGPDGQDAAELAFADKTCKDPPPKEVGETAEAFLAWPSVELTPVGEREEPSLEYEAKRARFGVDLKLEGAMKRVGIAVEQHLGGELAELDETGMASGQPMGEEDNERGWTSQWVLPRCSGRPPSDRAGPTGGHV